MKNNKITYLNIFVIVIIVIISIFIYHNYIKSTKFDIFNLIENFDNDENDINNYNDVLINQRKQQLFNDIKKYKSLELPININDNGNKCNDWSNDKLNRYPNGGNYCKLRGTDAICLDFNGKDTTCNKLYNIKIRDLANTDIELMVTKHFKELMPVFKKINDEISEKEIVVNKLIDQLIQLKNTNNQQNYFIDLNKTYLQNSENRERLISNINEEKNNEFNLENNEFQELKKDISSLNTENYKLNTALMYIVIVFIISIITFLLTRTIV